MATTSKTLTPTNQVVTIPDMTERPNASVLADGISKEADAINELNRNIAKRPYVYYAEPTFTDGIAEIPIATIQTAIGITTFSHVAASLESSSVIARNNYIVGASIQGGNVKIVCADSSKNGKLGICMLIW